MKDFWEAKSLQELFHAGGISDKNFLLDRVLRAQKKLWNLIYLSLWHVYQISFCFWVLHYNHWELQVSVSLSHLLYCKSVINLKCYFSGCFVFPNQFDRQPSYPEHESKGVDSIDSAWRFMRPKFCYQLPQLVWTLRKCFAFWKQKEGHGHLMTLSLRI